MFKPKATMSSFSVNDMGKAKEFYTKTLGLELNSEDMGLNLKLPGGGGLFIYEKPDHKPASFTVLNFIVDDIDESADELKKLGVSFERYDNIPGGQDDKGIARGIAAKQGPDIAWFEDPAGNILSIMKVE